MFTTLRLTETTQLIKKSGEKCSKHKENQLSFHEFLKVRSHGATSRRDMLRGHVVRSESHEATKLGENKSHKRLYALGHTKRHFHATSRSVK